MSEPEDAELQPKGQFLVWAAEDGRVIFIGHVSTPWVMPGKQR